VFGVALSRHAMTLSGRDESRGAHRR
jgi:hypothetical protein